MIVLSSDRNVDVHFDDAAGKGAVKVEHEALSSLDGIVAGDSDIAILVESSRRCRESNARRIDRRRRCRNVFGLRTDAKPDEDSVASGRADKTASEIDRSNSAGLDNLDL